MRGEQASKGAKGGPILRICPLIEMPRAKLPSQRLSEAIRMGEAGRAGGATPLLIIPVRYLPWLPPAVHVAVC